MALDFVHSRTVIQQLAQNASRTPPPDEDSAMQYIDRSLTILGRTFDVHNERMRQEFINQRDFVANQFRVVEARIDKRFGKVDQRFEEMQEKIDQRFKEAEKKNDQRFEEADTKMRNRLDHMQNLSRNSLRTRGWEEIYPVGPLDDQGGICTPKWFPHTVRRFWRLKDQPRRHRLVHLLRFYNVQRYEEWGMDEGSMDGGGMIDSDDSSDLSSKSSRLPIPLEAAVQSNLEIAHRALAIQLGLMYDEIRKFMDRAQELGKARTEQDHKRRQIDESSADKRRRILRQAIEEGLTEVTSPTEPLDEGSV